MTSIADRGVVLVALQRVELPGAFSLVSDSQWGLEPHAIVNLWQCSGAPSCI